MLQLSVALGLCVAGCMMSALLLHARADQPGQSRSRLPWVVILHPAVLFIGFFAYQEADRVYGSGLAGLAAWGVLWPLAVEIASRGRPYRVTRLLRLYLQNQHILPFGAEYKKYRRKARPLLCTQRVLMGVAAPISFAGLYITDWISNGI
ncbi:hypothetical protein R5O87_21965 [Arthrobacter globiformis]|uniref:hypothetical protein n=1 Tax=Arthrobacter globiformis TaxID=1665 RepID=UPI00397B42B1